MIPIDNYPHMDRYFSAQPGGHAFLRQGGRGKHEKINFTGENTIRFLERSGCRYTVLRGAIFGSF